MNWRELNRRGLIPGPEESLSAFQERVDQAAVNPIHSAERTTQLYGIYPDWVTLEESDKGLAPWHGGMMVTDGCKAALQVRRRLRWGYEREELISHEMAHAGRLAFDEPAFEEFFAYRTSGNRLRRWFGPVVQRPWEIWGWLGSLLVASWFPLVPITVLLAGVTRLWHRHRTLRRCVRNLEQKYGQRAWEVAYRLTDREIRQAARVRLAPNDSARWALINAVYETEC